MSDPFKISVLDIARGVTTIDGFETAGRANRRVESINSAKDGGLHAEYIGDSRDRVYIKKAARVAEAQTELLREHRLVTKWKPEVSETPEDRVRVLEAALTKMAGTYYYHPRLLESCNEILRSVGLPDFVKPPTREQKLLEAAKAVVAAGFDDTAPEGEEIDLNALHEKIEGLRAVIGEES